MGLGLYTVRELVRAHGGTIAVESTEYAGAAATLKDLESPPGNRLEALTRDRAGQHSIRINDQWRICFVWTEAGPTDIEITKYYQ